MADSLLTQNNADVFSTVYLPADKSQYEEFFSNIIFKTSPENQMRAGIYRWGGYSLGLPVGFRKDYVFHHSSGATITFETYKGESVLASKIHIIGSQEAINDAVSSLELLSERRLEKHLRNGPHIKPVL